MELVLHIGTEKTGTTTIQDFLDRNRSSLHASGVHYATSLGPVAHRRLAAYGMRHDRSDDFIVASQLTTADARAAFDRKVEHDLAHELGTLPDGIRSVVISSEHLHSRLADQDEVDKVCTLLAPYFETMRVVVYLRPQIDLATSLYSTVLRNGSTRTLDEFVTEHCVRDTSYYDYDALLERWRRAPGVDQLSARLFDAESFVGGDLVHDFCDAIGVSPDHASCAPPQRMNESLSPFGQFLLRTANEFVRPLAGDDRHNAVALAVRDAIITACPGRDSVDLSVARRVQAQWDAVNDRVRSSWFPDRASLFELDPARYGRRPIEFGEHEQDAVRAILRVMNDWSMSGQHADVVRDAALTLEDTDLQQARALMALAKMFRPHGPFIGDKLREYDQRLAADEPSRVGRLTSAIRTRLRRDDAERGEAS